MQIAPPFCLLSNLLHCERKLFILSVSADHWFLNYTFSLEAVTTDILYKANGEWGVFQSLIHDLWLSWLSQIALFSLPTAFQHNKHSNTSIIFLPREQCTQRRSKCGGSLWKRFHCWQPKVIKHPVLHVATNHFLSFFMLWVGYSHWKHDGVFVLHQQIC